MTDAEVLRAIATHESNNDPNAIGKSGEVGKYQFMPATIRALGGDINTLKGNSAKQDELALKHYSALKAKYGEDQDKIIAAWNAGEGGVNKAVKQGGEDWQKFLPKGTNQFGAAYDAGAYLTKVKSLLAPEQAGAQVAQAGQQPQQAQQGQAPTALAQEPTPETPSPGLVMNPETKIANAHVKNSKVDVMKWAQDFVGSAPATKPQSPQQEQPKVQEAGGFFNSVGSAFKTAGNAAISSFGKPVADFLVPPAPVKDGSLPRRMADRGIDTMVQGANEVGELLMPSPQEAQRRSQLPIGQQAMGLAQGAASAVNATPLGGVIGAAGEAVSDFAGATSDMSDEGLKAQLTALEQHIPSPEELSQGAGGIQAQIENVRGLLMIPYDQRVKKIEEFGRSFGENAAGAAPLPMMLGVPKMLGRVSGALTDVKLARQALIAQAGEAAATRAAAETAAAPKAAARAAEVTPEQSEYMRLQMKRGSTPDADAKLRQIEAEEGARKAIDDIFQENVPDMAQAATAAAPEVPAAGAKPSPVARIVEDSTFEGKSQRAVLGPNDNMVVALDKDGKDLGFLWYTREPGGGYTVRKIEVAEGARRQGVAKALDQAVTDAEGPYKGATAQTAEGKAFRASRGGEPKLQPAPENLYRELRDAFQGDLDLVDATLASRGFKTPELGLQENKALHEAMGLKQGAADAEKMAAQDSLIKTASDIGITPEQGVEALPSMVKIAKDIPSGDLKSAREIVAAAIKDPEHPLSALRSLQGALNEDGKINSALLFAMTRATLGAVTGGMVGDDMHERARNALLGAGFGLALSPKLATRIVENLKKPEVLNALKDALTLHGEQGALRFPSRGVGKNPSPNTENMNVSPVAKRVVRGINEQLEKLDMLARSKVQSKEMTQAGARNSRFNQIENVLSLDSAKLSPDELASAGLAARSFRDALVEDLVASSARAGLNPGDVGLAEEVMAKGALLTRTTQQVTNLETAFGRATQALGIMTDTTMASKFDLAKFGNEIEIWKNALMAEGKVSPTQFVEMINKLASSEQVRKVAQTSSKWPAALWNVYYGLNLLSSPLTHFRNVLGNTGALGMAVIDRAGGEILGSMYRAAGYKGATVARGETYELFSGVLEMIGDSFRAGTEKGAFGYFETARTTGRSAFGPGKYSEMLSAVETSESLGNGPLARIVQTMSTLGGKNMAIMTGTDEFFKVLSYHGEMRALARRGSQHLKGAERLAEYERLMDDPTTAMIQAANDFAHENTFTKAFTESQGAKNLFGLGKGIEGAVNNPIAKVMIAPFFRTPVRLGEFSTVHTPVLNLMAPQFWSDMAAGGAKQQLAMAKVATGLGMFATMGSWAASGYITGAAPGDPSLRKKWEAAGWQEKSIYVPGINKYISYDNIEPFSTVVSTIATFMQAAPDMDEAAVQSVWSAGVTALANSAFSKQWYSGIQDWSEAIQAMGRGADMQATIKLLARRSATFIPGGSLFRNVQNATDPFKRDPQSVAHNENPELREFEKLVHIYAQNVPGWGGRNALEIAGYRPRPAARNGITGEKLANENQWLGFVNPFRITGFKNDKVLNEVVALEGAGLPQELIPRVLGGSQPGSPYKFQGNELARTIKEGVKLSDEERDRLGTLLTEEITDHNGDTMHQAMARRMEEEDWSDLKDGKDGGKAIELQRIYHQYLDEASRRLLEEYPRIDISIQRRQIMRDGRRIPKSMDDVTDERLQEVGPRYQ